MKVIVVGSGEVGFHIAERLSKEGHAVTVIEKNREKEQLLKSKLNALSGPRQWGQCRYA